VIAFAAQRLGKHIGVIAKLLCRFLNAGLGGRGDVAGQRRVIQDNGNGGGGESAFFGHVPDRDRGSLAALGIWHWAAPLCGRLKKPEYSGKAQEINFQKTVAFIETILYN